MVKQDNVTLFLLQLRYQVKQLRAPKNLRA